MKQLGWNRNDRPTVVYPATVGQIPAKQLKCHPLQCGGAYPQAPKAPT